MRIIDLTHSISKDMPLFPGTGRPRLVTSSNCRDNGFRETLISMYSHTGTHMDAPAHVFADGRTLDSFSIDMFVGRCLVIDCGDLSEGGRIRMERVDAARSQSDSVDFILFYTGWSRYWGDDAYFGDYPCIAEDVAEYLTESGKKGIGVDTLGVDQISDANLTIHKLLLPGSGMVIMENLTNLEKIGRGIFTLCSLPLKFENSDGAPARTIAIVE